MRLDKFTATASELSRSEATKAIRGGAITVNGKTEKNPKTAVDAAKDEIKLKGEALTYREFVYLMLNKPEGYICSTKDARQQTVLELLPKFFADRKPHSCGRLDIDTTGLVLLTDDGNWSYGITAPKKKCYKTYLINSLSELSEEDIQKLEEGIILEGEEKATLPAKIKRLDHKYYELQIMEGRFHQIKRMFTAVYNKVLKLHRQSIGPISLGDLPVEEFRELTTEEIDSLRK